MHGLHARREMRTQSFIYTKQTLCGPITRYASKARVQCHLALIRRVQALEASQEGTSRLISNDVVNDNNMTSADYQVVTRASSGINTQTGPAIEDAILALGFELDEQATAKDKFNRKLYRCKFLQDIKRLAYEWQISGMADMLLKTYGEIPTCGLPEKHIGHPDAKAALEVPRPSVQACGHLNANQTGTGKTVTTLLAISWAAEYVNTDEIYKPTFLNVPKQIVLQ